MTPVSLSPADPVIPFGKHKGKQASDIPVSYLDWLVDQPWLHEQLRIDVESHLNGARRAEWERMQDDAEAEDEIYRDALKDRE